MSRPTRFERRKPLVCTEKPSDSSHSWRSAIWVERPEPSMPSMTTKVPLRSLGSRPTSDSPKKDCEYSASALGAADFVGGVTDEAFASAIVGGTVLSFSWSGILFRLRHARCESLEINFGGDNIAHLFLKLVDGKRAVQYHKIIGVDHFVVLLENASLEKAETFGTIVGKP